MLRSEVSDSGESQSVFIVQDKCFCTIQAQLARTVIMVLTKQQNKTLLKQNVSAIIYAHAATRQHNKKKRVSMSTPYFHGQCLSPNQTAKIEYCTCCGLVSLAISWHAIKHICHEARSSLPCTTVARQSPLHLKPQEYWCHTTAPTSRPPGWPQIEPEQSFGKHVTPGGKAHNTPPASSNRFPMPLAT